MRAARVSAAYGAAGERCMSISVAVAVGDSGDRLVDAIAARLPKLRIGDGADADTDMGPLITAEHRDKVAGYIDAGESAGASDVVHAAADARVAVPMRPGLRSLNVAVAGAMILGEALRQTGGFAAPR